MRDGQEVERFRPAVCSRFQTCDPAASASSVADYFVLSAWPRANLVWLACERGELELPEQVATCQRSYRWHHADALPALPSVAARKVVLVDTRILWGVVATDDGLADYYLLLGRGQTIRRGKSVRLPRIGILHSQVIKAVLEAEWPKIKCELPPASPDPDDVVEAESEEFPEGDLDDIVAAPGADYVGVVATCPARLPDRRPRRGR